LHDNFLLGFDRFRVVGAESDVEVENCPLMLVAE
jgi:hypothetical protein